MKKLYIILALVVVSFLMVFAGDTIKILRIYHDGTVTAIPIAYIDSIDHSKYDNNGKLQANYTSSIIETLDSTYNIHINVIDSVAVMKINMEEYKKNIENIHDYIVKQEDLKINQFQNRLADWLNSQEWIHNATISASRDLITATLKNGVLFFISFQDISSQETDDQDYIPSNRSSGDVELFEPDVSSLLEEVIIDNANVLYIQGRNMVGSTAVEEFEKLQESISESPVDCKLLKIAYDLSFLDQDFSKYGLIIISQTHGAKDLRGSFQVENTYDYYLTPAGYALSTKNGTIERSSIKSVFWVNLSKISSTNNAIIYGNYCWSYGLAKSNNQATIVGYSTASNYLKNDIYLIDYCSALFKGIPHYEAMKEIPAYSFWGWLDEKFQKMNVVPFTNNPNSKLRYFSIKTNEITGKGITGIINGYKNLKKDKIEWILYAHEGKEKFTPKDINVKRIEGAYEPKSDGSFTISRDVVNKYPDHAFIVGFEYVGKVYYGEMKTLGIHLCPDENHPHMIDLGLPSGTKWACCNVGALEPKDVGYYYAWGMLIESEGYNEDNYKYCKEVEPYGYEYDYLGIDISGTKYDVAQYEWGSSWRMPTLEDCNELYQATTMNNFHQEMINLNGVWGTVIRSNNGNAVFFPYAGIKMTVGKKVDFLNSYGSAGSYWTSTTDNPENVYGSVSYSFSVGGGASVDMDQPNVHAKYHGLSVRPVAQ